MQEYYELVQKGFRTLHPLMAGYIGMEMNKSYHNEWWSEVLYALSDQWDIPQYGDYTELIDSLDIANCLRLIDRRWNEVFRNKLSINYRTWAKELMSVRNAVAHIGQQDMPQTDAERVLDTMARLCDAFDKEGAAEIRKLYNNARNIGIARAKRAGPSMVSREGPMDINVPPTENAADLMREGEIKNLLQLIGTEIVQKTTLTRKVTYAGKTAAYPVYRVRLDALYYNDQNDRIATWITRYRSENGADSLARLTSEAYNGVIETFIYESNPESIQKTQKNIALVGQREPGVALSDGRIVDGNRRYTCLRRIQRETSEPIYFETVIMDVDIQKDKKQIKLLELAIQHGEEKKVDYDLIDYAIGTYIDVVKTKLLTIEEYASSTNEPVADVRKRIECAEIICEFLEYLKLPEQYHIARDLQVYSLFQEMMVLLKQLSGEEKQQLKVIAFNNVLMKALLDQRKFIRDIKTLIKNNTYLIYFNDQMELNAEIHSKFDPFEIHSRGDLDRFAQSNEPLTEELQLSLQRAMLRSRKQQLKAKPSENVIKSISLLNEVDSRLFGKMDDVEKRNLRHDLGELSTIVRDFSTLLSDDETTVEVETQNAVTPPMPASTNIPPTSMMPDIVVTKRYNTFRIAPADPSIPYVLCTTAGKPISRLFVTMRFTAIALGESVEREADCKAYFVDDMGNAISDIREISLQAGGETSVHFSMQPDSVNKKKCHLVIQDKTNAPDEALQLIPFDLNLSSSARK